jgi:AcrR family transcriptional regulator
MLRVTRHARTRLDRAPLAERRQQRRAELLEAAIDVIRREGADVTMEEMATAGGISKPILYRHFTDRDGMLDAKLGEARTAAPPESIRATIDAYFEYIERNPELYRFIVEADASRGSPATHAFTAQIARQVSDTLAQGLVDGGFDPAPAEVWGRAIVGMVQFTAEWWTAGADVGRAETVDQLTKLVWVGINGSVSSADAASRPARNTS